MKQQKTSPISGSIGREAIIENLRDAACEEEFIEKFLYLCENGTEKEQQQLLACQRCRLLDGVHAEQKKLDCLDYLRYQIEKESKNAKKKVND